MAQAFNLEKAFIIDEQIKTQIKELMVSLQKTKLLDSELSGSIADGSVNGSIMQSTQVEETELDPLSREQAIQVVEILTNVLFEAL